MHYLTFIGHICNLEKRIFALSAVDNELYCSISA